jgi:hypothetical protein
VTDRWFEVEYPSMLACMEAKREKLNSVKINNSTPMLVRTELRITCVEGEL